MTATAPEGGRPIDGRPIDRLGLVLLKSAVAVPASNGPAAVTTALAPSPGPTHVSPGGLRENAGGRSGRAGVSLREGGGVRSGKVGAGRRPLPPTSSHRTARRLVAKVSPNLPDPDREGRDVLREAFAYGYREIAAVLDLTEADCRQLYRRAAGRVAVQGVRGWPGLLRGRGRRLPALVARAGTCSWAPRPSRSGVVS